MNKRKMLWLIPALLALIALVVALLLPKGEGGWRPAAERPQQLPTEEHIPQTDPSISLETEPSQTQSPNGDDPPDTGPPSVTEPPLETNPLVPPEPPLEYSHFGRYSGVFVEDGTDARVENVAVMLVTNVSDRFLEYASIQYAINGVQAEFVVNGLPPGSSAWVLESNKLVIPSGSVFTYVDETTGFSSGGNVSDGLSVRLEQGAMTVVNTGDTAMKNVYIYYKKLHTDGHFLGGITYRVAMGDLEPDSPITATAGHCTPEGCLVVKVTRES